MHTGNSMLARASEKVLTLEGMRARCNLNSIARSVHERAVSCCHAPKTGLHLLCSPKRLPVHTIGAENACRQVSACALCANVHWQVHWCGCSEAQRKCLQGRLGKRRQKSSSAQHPEFSNLGRTGAGTAAGQTAWHPCAFSTDRSKIDLHTPQNSQQARSGHGEPSFADAQGQPRGTYIDGRSRAGAACARAGASWPL